MLFNKVPWAAIIWILLTKIQGTKTVLQANSFSSWPDQLSCYRGGTCLNEMKMWFYALAISYSQHDLKSLEDFSTLKNVLKYTWESCEGMDTFSFQSIMSSSTISSSLTQIFKTNLVLVSMSRSPLTKADVTGFQHYFKPSLSILIQVNCGVSTQYVNCSNTAVLCGGDWVQVEPCSPSLLPHVYGSGLNHFLSFLGPSQDPSRLIMAPFSKFLIRIDFMDEWAVASQSPHWYICCVSLLCPLPLKGSLTPQWRRISEATSLYHPWQAGVTSWSEPVPSIGLSQWHHLLCGLVIHLLQLATPYQIMKGAVGYGVFPSSQSHMIAQCLSYST